MYSSKCLRRKKIFSHPFFEYKISWILILFLNTRLENSIIGSQTFTKDFERRLLEEMKSSTRSACMGLIGIIIIHIFQHYFEAKIISSFRIHCIMIPFTMSLVYEGKSFGFWLIVFNHKNISGFSRTISWNKKQNGKKEKVKHKLIFFFFLNSFLDSSKF